MQVAQEMFQVSERRVCRALEQPRSTQKYVGRKPNDEETLTLRLVELASQYGRYGYRRITALLQHEGWRVNHKRVERLWRQEGLKVPAKQPKRGRLWLKDGSCLRLKPEFPGHVWSYDFVLERTQDGRAFRILNIIDEYTRECLAVKIQRRLDHEDVQECLTELFCSHGVPVHLRSDNGPEFIAHALREWLNKLSLKPLFIEPGSPWENGYVESFNGKMRESGLFCDHELLNREIFYTLREAQILIERWRKDYNHFRPHSSLGYCPPAPQAWLISAIPQSGLT